MDIEWPDKDGNLLRGKIPAHVEPFVSAIGLEATAKLLLEFGGAPIYVTSTPKNRSRLVEAIGREKAIALGEAFSFGMSARIPIGNSFLCRYFKSQGLSVHDIARKTRLTDVSVRKYLRSGHPPRQAATNGEGS